MTTITYTSPSGRTGTYTTLGDSLSWDGGEAVSQSTERISDLVALVADSVTSNGTTVDHADNFHQALTCLLAEIEASEKPVGFLSAGEIVTSLKSALRDALNT